MAGEPSPVKGLDGAEKPQISPPSPEVLRIHKTRIAANLTAGCGINCKSCSRWSMFAPRTQGVRPSDGSVCAELWSGLALVNT
jgi:L-lysine 2,3-aminomutase